MADEMASTWVGPKGFRWAVVKAAEKGATKAASTAATWAVSMALN